MELNIKINLDNAAFQYGAGWEVARIANTVPRQMTASIEGGESGRVALRDVNGNTVGYYEVTP